MEQTNQQNMEKVGLPTKTKIAMIIAFRDFRDAEYFVPKEFGEKIKGLLTEF